MVILYLIKEFIIIGGLGIGGGMVAIPFIQNIASTTGWITEAQIVEMIAITEITPGPLVVNMATYTGYIVAGILGGILTTMAVILPQIIIIYFIYKVLNKFKENKNVLIILKGIRPVSLALTAGGALTILQSAFFKATDNYTSLSGILQIFNWKCILLGIALIALMRKVKIHPIFYFIICGIIGVVFKLS